MAFSVRRRTNEIGVRMALGAHKSRIVRMVLLQGMWRCALGIVLGLVPAWYLGTAMRELLFNVTPADPLVLSLTIGVLLGAGFLASLVPALRAASVDPLVALRSE
jgi:ABC-type antimicrobial peptide transport system permease subunit